MGQIVLQTAGVFSGGCLRTFNFSKIYALFTFGKQLKVPFTFRARAMLAG